MDLLERTAALEGLATALRAAQAGDGRLVLVSGEAGVGKTALIEAFVAAHGAGPDTAWGFCEAMSAPRPLGPFRDIARQIGGRLLALFAEDAAAPKLLPEIMQELEQATPAVLVVEDVHWADNATLDMLRFLGRRVQRLPTLIVATYRDDEIDATHPLRPVLGALATSRAVSRIALAPLSAAAVRALAGDAPVDSALLYRRTCGNPFFVTEVLASDASGAVPRAVRDLVFERMARLDDRARTLLQTAALIGRAETHLLRRLSAGASAEVDSCIAAGLLTAAGEATIFRHELTRDAVVETISGPRRAELHARILGALQTAGETEPARLLHHAWGAGDAVAVRTHATAAARQASAVGAHREAMAQYARALRYTGADMAQERAALLVAYAKECTTCDRHQTAIGSLAEAVGLWRSLGEPRQEGAALAAMAAPLVQSGLNAEADARGREAIAILEPLGSSQELATALQSQAQLRMLDRDQAQALHFGNRAILMAIEIGAMPTLAAANHTVGVAMLVADDPKGRRHLDRSMDLARKAGLDALVSLGYLNAGSAYAEQYHLAEAEAFLDDGIAYAAERDMDAHLHYMQAWRALVLLYRGRLAEAVVTAADLVATHDQSAVARMMALVALGRARARLGEAGADEALDEALALAAPTGTLQRLAPVRLARAEAAWLAGDAARALAEAEAVWVLAASHRHQWHGGEIAYWQRCCGAPAQVPAWIAQPYALQVAGDWLAAAEAWAAIGCPYAQARALADGDEGAQLAALQRFDSLGAKPAAESLRRRMRAAGIRHVPRGPRTATRANSFGLTARQHEIVMLLAEGLTNAKISRRLKISIKTVDHHVSAILARLNVATRAEAARLILGQHEMPAASTPET